MSAAENASKNKAMTAYLKKMNVTRTSGKCPWGCGSLISNGGKALLSHLSMCTGRHPRKASY